MERTKNTTSWKVWIAGLMVFGCTPLSFAGAAKIQLKLTSLTCQKVSTEKEEGDADEIYCMVIGLNSDSTTYKNVLPGSDTVWTLKKDGTQAVENLLEPTGKGAAEIKLFEDESAEVFVLFFESDGDKKFAALRDKLLKGLRFGLNDQGKAAGGMVERALKSVVETGDEYLGGISFKATYEEKLVKTWRPISILRYHEMTPAQLKKLSNKPEYRELAKSVKLLDVTTVAEKAKGKAKAKNPTTFLLTGGGSTYEVIVE